MILIKMEKNGKSSNSVSWTHQDMLLKYREKKAPTTKHSSATQLWENDDKINAQRSFYLEPVKKILVSTGNREQNCTMEGGYNICTKMGLSCSQKATTKEWHRVPVFHAFLKTTTTTSTTTCSLHFTLCISDMPTQYNSNRKSSYHLLIFNSSFPWQRYQNSVAGISPLYWRWVWHTRDHSIHPTF